MANPEKEVISFVGDGSYLLNNTDIYSSVITKNKLIIIVCDNGGFAVINRLQLFKGGKEYNNLLKSSNTPGLVDVDFAKHAEAMGATALKTNSISELEAALAKRHTIKGPYVVVIETDPYPSTQYGGTWWDVGVPEVSERTSVNEAYAAYIDNKKKQRVN